LPAPIDSVNVHVRDSARLLAECKLVRSLGFGAKACIHPVQLEIVNEIFSPTADDLDWARRVLAGAEDAAASGLGAFELDGQMVDRPVVERARRLLDRHHELSG
jgi:citrate lyase subunit beta/citryl-CoA lyase